MTIIQNDPVLLRRPCEDATVEEAQSIIDQLDRELEHSARMGRVGIGLAAAQIGILKKVAIVRIDQAYRVDLVNARIEKRFDEQRFRDEACLSFPGRVEQTMRAQEIYVTGNLCYPHSFIATGLLAVVCQHELDHTAGIILPDVAIKPVAITAPKSKPRPNEPCWCGKPAKYKRCHGA